MDYAWEELLRQHRALAALMIGGRGEEPEETAEVGGHGGTDRAEAPRPAETGGEAWDRPEDEALSLVPADTTARPWREMAHRRQAAGTEAKGTERTMEVRERQKRNRGADGVGTVRQAAVLGRETGTVLARTAAEPAVFLASHGDGAVSAQAVSRAFQRDARRYDGGFTLY